MARNQRNHELRQKAEMAVEAGDLSKAYLMNGRQKLTALLRYAGVNPRDKVRDSRRAVQMRDDPVFGAHSAYGPKTVYVDLDLAALTDDQRGRLQAGFQQLVQFGARQRVVDGRWCYIAIKA